jgi:glc operon protein GlcG
MSCGRVGTLLAIVALTVGVRTASAQALTNPYGPSINLEAAKRAAAAAVAEVRKNNWNMAVAITDPAGELVYFEKIDGTQAASINIAVEKARSAARFKRPTKVFQDALASGGAELR